MKKQSVILGIITVLMVLILQIKPDVTAYAYTKSDYNYKDGRYYVDNLEKHTHDNTITLYMLFPKSSFLEGDIYYDFLCFSDNFPDGSYYKDLGYETLRYHTKLDTAKTVAEDVGEGVVVSFGFNVENGTYVFCTNDYSYGICTLTKDYKNPLIHKRNFNDETTVWQEKVTLNNEHLDLYAIMGGEEFIVNNMDAMSNYAKGLRQSELSGSQKENNMRDALSGMVSSDTDKDELNSIVNELMKDDSTGTDKDNMPSDDKDNSYVNKNLDVNNSATNSDGVSITTNKGNTGNDEPDNTEDKKTDIKTYITVVIGILVLAILFIIAKKKKH